MPPTYLARAESLAILRARGWEDVEFVSMSDKLADWIATGLEDYGRPGTCGVFGADQGPKGAKTHSRIADPDAPTVEEIARAANTGDAFGLPLKHRAATAKAQAEKRAALVAAGRQTATRDGFTEATLMALANIAAGQA